MASVWDVPVDALFQYVHRFYRKEKDHIHLKYAQRVQLLALFKQVKLGSYSVEKDTAGYFDVMGADRRKAWKALGDISKEEAQCEIVKLLEGVCPQLKEVVLNDHNAAGKQQERQHMEAEEPTGQRVVNGGREAVDVHLDSAIPPPKAPAVLSSPSKQQPQPLLPPRAALAPAALWCSPNAARNFIRQLQVAPADPATSAPLTVAPRETVSVQVPTSTHASAIFWEFATEGGGIGFGLGFQWSEMQGLGEGQDSKLHRRSEQLLPVTMRDCWEDLVLGSHQYQEEGTYTLDFVNSHSTLPKTVYYKVFYQNTTS